MIHYYPLDRSIGMFVLGGLGLFLSIALLRFFISILLVLMSLIAIYIGIYGLTKRKKEPMTYDNNTLSFYKKGKLIEVYRDNIEKIFYNTRGIDKRVTILSKNKEIDIPVVYGLAELVKKLNRELDLT